MRNGTWTPGWRSALCLVLALPLLGVVTTAAAGGDVTSSVDLKFWGRAVFNVHYDTSILSQDFMSYVTDDQNEEVNFNPRDTRLGFKASGTSGDWTYSGVFEMDFYGTNASNNLIPRMRLGYAEAKNGGGLSIRGGQDWVPVAAQNPGTLDFGVQSWSGNLWWRVPQLTVRYKPSNVEFLVSAMKHRVSNDQEQQEKMPWLLGRVAFSDLLGEGSLLAIGGGVRSVSDLTFSRTAGDPPVQEVSMADYSPYLLALELKVPFADGFEVKGEVYTGQGVGREFVHYGLDYNPWHPDGAREIASKGGFLSLKVPAGEKIHFNAGYGFDDPDNEDLAGSSAPYSKNQSIFANMKYAVTKQFGWGLEFINFTTTVGDGDAEVDLDGQRFTGSMWFIF